MSNNDTKLASGTMPPKNGLNPGGRPKGSKNLKTMMWGIALTPLTMPVGGKKTTLSLMDAILLQLRKAAVIDTSPRAVKLFRRLQEKNQPEITNEHTGLLIAPARMTPEEWIKNQEEKNKTRKPPPGVEDK